jgi:hypothetical protein
MALYDLPGLMKRFAIKGRSEVSNAQEVTYQQESEVDKAYPEPGNKGCPSAFVSIFTLDLRSLSLMRVGVALVLLIDLVIRFSDLEAHYTDTGIMPLELLFRQLWNPAFFSLYTMAGSWPLQSVVFLLNFLCIGCLLLGYRTRLFTILCWIFLLSLHNRNPLIQQGGDDLLRMLLFWGIFLPWHSHYSLDSRRSGQMPLPSNQYRSLAGLAYVYQIFYMYFFSALLKSSPEWNSEFTALYYTLSLEQIVTPVGHYMHQFGDVLKLLTLITYYTELVLPFLLFVPFFNAYFRIAFLAVIFLFHIGISLMLYVGLFPLISLVSLIGLVPVLVQDRHVHRLDRLLHRCGTLLHRQADRFQWRSFASGHHPSLPGPRLSAEKLPTSLLLVFFMAYTFVWNLETLGKPVASFQKIHWIGYLLRIDQHWGMFAPAVFKDDGWFVLKGRTVSGREVNVADPDAPVSYDKPRVMSDFFKNDRWRKYHENILLVSNSYLRLYYCAYLTNQWNQRQTSDQNRIPQLQIIYMKEVSLPHYRLSKPTKELLFECDTAL